MGYMHIDNLYKTQDILLFREAYALEKVHGTSAHVSISTTINGPLSISLFSGGEKQALFESLFDLQELSEKFLLLGRPQVRIYGEAYGGKCQGMRATYGGALRFIVFDVQIGDWWLDVPNAEQVATGLGLEFVPYAKVSTDLASLDAERDRDSEVAIRRGMGAGHKREGIVLRPLIEVTKNNGSRIIAKHKREEFSERSTPQKVVDPDKLAVLTAASAIASEWVTEMRLTHVLDQFPDAGMEQMPDILRAMVADVEREATGEIIASKDARRAISSRTVALFKERLKANLK
jgi:hypothetical protein